MTCATVPPATAMNGASQLEIAEVLGGPQDAPDGEKLLPPVRGPHPKRGGENGREDLRAGGLGGKNRLPRPLNFRYFQRFALAPAIG